MEQDWTVIRVRGDGGLPAVNALQFLSCIAAVRELLGDRRWHFRWIVDDRRHSADGLRVEVPFGARERAEVIAELERRVPPPDVVHAEPLRWETDLDNVQTPEELDDSLDLLWRYSDFLADLRLRNPRASLRSFMHLSPGAFLFFITGDRRHLEHALDKYSFGSVPPVSFGRVVELVRARPLSYRVPPRSHEEAVNAARIYHLASCTLASEFYPYTSA